MKYVLLFILSLVAFLVTSGCAPVHPPSPAAIVAPTGTDIDKAGAYVNSAEAAVKAAIPHTDAAGKEDLSLASNAHSSASTSLVRAKADLLIVENEIAERDKTNANLVAQVLALTNSWGHRLQVIVTRIVVVLLILLALHFIAGAVAIFAPPPYGTIAGMISTIVNPFGWFTYVVTHVTLNAAHNLTTAPIVDDTAPKAFP